MAITAERAKELIQIGGRVRVEDPNLHSSPLNGRAPAAIPILRVEGNRAIVKPYRHGGKEEKVPLESLTEWKAHNTLQEERARIQGSKKDSQTPTGFVVIHTEKLLAWAGPTGKDRGWTKEIGKAKVFDEIVGARRARGHLVKATEWQAVLGEDAHVEAVPLADAQKKFAEKYRQPVKPSVPQTSIHPEVAPVPAPSADQTASNPHTNGHLNGQSNGLHRLDLAALNGGAEALPKPILDRLGGDVPMTFEVSDSAFSELRAAYRDYEIAVMQAIEARQRIITALGKIAHGVGNGMSAMGISAPS